MKVSILGPDYLDAQLVGGPTHDPRHGSAFAHPDPAATVEDHSLTFEQEVFIAENFEHKSGTTTHHPQLPPPLTPAEALRLKHQHLQSINVLAEQFGAKIVDVSENSIIVEMSGKTTRVEAFLSLLKPFGIIESARTGKKNMLPIILRSLDHSLTTLIRFRNHGHAAYTNCFSTKGRNRRLRFRRCCSPSSRLKTHTENKSVLSFNLFVRIDLIHSRNMQYIHTLCSSYFSSYFYP